MGGDTKLPPAEKLWSTFDYDQAGGRLIRRDDPARGAYWRERWGGKPCGWANERGYIYVGFGRRLLLAHRVIWKMHHGDEPSVIDHIDGDPSNNRLSNLRQATQTDNLANSRRRAHKLLPKGVRQISAGRFSAEVRRHGQRFRLGVFGTPDDAHQAYVAAGQDLHGEFFRAD